IDPVFFEEPIVLQDDVARRQRLIRAPRRPRPIDAVALAPARTPRQRTDTDFLAQPSAVFFDCALAPGLDQKPDLALLRRRQLADGADEVTQGVAIMLGPSKRKLQCMERKAPHF